MTCKCNRLLLVIGQIKEERLILEAATTRLLREGKIDAYKTGRCHIEAYTNVLEMLDTTPILEIKSLTFYEKLKLIFMRKKK